MPKYDTADLTDRATAGSHSVGFDREVLALAASILDEGVAPGLHRKYLAELRDDWPTLAQALAALIRHRVPDARTSVPLMILDGRWPYNSKD